MADVTVSDPDRKSSRSQRRPVIKHAIDPKPALVLIMLICAVQPVYFYLGSTLLTPLRLLLLVAFVPMMLAWLNGKAGRIILPDLMMLGYSCWTFVAAFVNHGTALPAALLVAQMVETVGPYMMARLYIRSLDSFRFFVRSYLTIILILLPFLAFEAVTRIPILVQLYEMLPGLHVHSNVNYEQRMGLTRAQGPFEHPILMGMFCALPVALAWYTLQSMNKTTMTRVWWVLACTAGTFFTVSSGPLFGIIAQFGLMGWDIVMSSYQKRWVFVMWMIVLLYILADIVIESPPILYFITHATFSGATAWNRVLIWEYGSAEVMRHPIFGISFNDWTRPAWMVSSFDNFWLLIAMLNGLVGFGLMVGAILIIMIRLGFAKLDHVPEISTCRRGYLLSFTGIAIALGTVWLWSGTYVVLMFFFGAAVWMLDHARKPGTEPAGLEATPDSPASAQPERPGRPRYTRFPGRAAR